jgi:hypothetical protein
MDTFLSTEDFDKIIEPSKVQICVKTHDLSILLQRSMEYTNTSSKLLNDATRLTGSFQKLMADIENKMSQMQHLLYEEDASATHTKKIKSFVTESDVLLLMAAQKELTHAFLKAYSSLNAPDDLVKVVKDRRNFYNFISYSYTFVNTACKLVKNKEIKDEFSKIPVYPRDFEALPTQMEKIHNDSILLLNRLDIDALREKAFVLYEDFRSAVPEGMRKRLAKPRQSCAVM